MTHHRKTRPEPNAADPLSEPTVNRRIWAAYLQRGFNRAAWARALELTYVAVNDWDSGKSTPHLSHLIRIVELLERRYTLDELCFGRAAPPARRAELELDRDAIKRLLAELNATNEQIEALGEYERSAAGQFQRYTRTYVAAFVEAFAAAREHGHTAKQAIVTAKTAAANARANAEAIALGVRAPITADELAQFGASVRAKRQPNSNERAEPARKQKPPSSGGVRRGA